MKTFLYIIASIATINLLYWAAKYCKYLLTYKRQQREFVKSLEVGHSVFVKHGKSFKCVQITSIGADHIRALDLDMNESIYKKSRVLV
jgi:hypothetical protein